MTIRETIGSSTERLGKSTEQILAVEVLLAFVMNMRREELFTYPDMELAGPDEKKFWELFGRFYAGEPVAYLTNRKEFYGLNFYIDENVLIPRPETELLVDEVIRLYGKCSAKLRILEVGTGSGCIAVSLAKCLKNAEIVATDISAAALTVARRNARDLGVGDRIVFFESDLIANVAGSFDIVVANLPYIGEKKYRFVSKEAFAYEPHVALFGGENGLQLYERLFKQMVGQVWRPRILLGEFGFLQGEDMRVLLKKYFQDETREILKDYASIERIFMVAF